MSPFISKVLQIVTGHYLTGRDSSLPKRYQGITVSLWNGAGLQAARVIFRI